MICAICKKGELAPKESTFVVEVGQSLIIFKNVPSMVCEVCGEVYFDESVAEEILSKADTLAASDVEIEIRDYKNVA
jgi:YgiT-type zinc finger domain-containing protein